VEIAGEFTFDAPQNLVWEALQDPAVLSSVMPGGEEFAQIGENEYTGALKVKVGVVQGVFNAQIKLSEIVAPKSYQIAVDGSGAPGFVKATGGIQLEARGADQTFMAYTGSAQIGGRIASVGQRLLDTTARSIIRQSLEGLNEYLKVKAAQQVSAPPPAASETASTSAAPSQASAAPAPVVPGYKPPSQMQVGLNVARDVLNAYISPSAQPVVLLGIVAIIVVIILLLSR
jgi:carbon monoxide dehydrogenase subunit G